MKAQKALEVLPLLMDIFGIATISRVKYNKKEWELKVEKNFLIQPEIQNLESICQQFSLNYEIEDTTIRIWEMEK